MEAEDTHMDLVRGIWFGESGSGNLVRGMWFGAINSNSREDIGLAAIFTPMLVQTAEKAMRVATSWRHKPGV